MKLKNYISCLIISFFSLSNAQRGILDLIGFPKAPERERKIFAAGGVQERKHELEQSQATLEDLKKTEKDFASQTQSRLDKLSANIADLKRKIDEKSGKDIEEFYNKKLTVFNDEYQILLNMQVSRKELLTTIEQQIASIKTFLEDPLFKKIRIEQKTFYTFQDLLASSRKIVDQEEKISHLIDQKNTLIADIESRKREAASVEKLYKDKVKEQEEFNKQVTIIAKEKSEEEIRRKGEIFDIEKDYLSQNINQVDFQNKLLERKLGALDTKISIERSQLRVFQDDFTYVIKPSLRISESDVAEEENDVQKKRQESAEVAKKYYVEIKNLATERDKLKKDLEQLSKRLNISLAEKRSLDEWKVKPESVESYLAFSHVGHINDRILVLDRRIETKTVSIALENEQVRYEEVEAASIKTWQKIIHSLFEGDDEIVQENKKYETYKTDLKRDLATFTEKRTTATSQLNIQNIAFANIRKRREELNLQRDKIFKNDVPNFNKCSAWLSDAQKMITVQIELNNKVIEKYSLIMSTIASTLKQIQAVTGQLSTFGIWKRSARAISLEGIKNIFPDFKFYIIELSSILVTYFSYQNISGILQSWINFFNQPITIWLIFIFQIMTLLALFLIIRMLLPNLYSFIFSSGTTVYGIFTISRVCAVIIGFITKHLFSLYIWSVIFLWMHIDGITQAPSAAIILFYLISIVYLLYIANRFVQYFVKFNRDQGYIILSEIFQHRFAQVFAIFSYSSIVILLTREIVAALSLISFTKSELPTILLAFYSITFRISLIFLIGKEEILSIIPTHTLMWQWIAQQISRFYYFLLVALIFLMIMSDPYIGGYANLVSYVLWSSFLTAVVIRIFSIFHEYVKRLAAWFFFIQEGESRKERFEQSKTWYGVSIIAVFIFMLIAGIIVTAFIWGRPITGNDIWEFFNKSLFSAGRGPDDKPIQISIVSFIRLFIFIFSGFLISSLINKFVFQRIFDVLLIEAGIQNTVASISRYLIVVTAIIVGFRAVGLSSFLFSIGVLIAGISWIIQEPIKDFASYFILLVQRPIKIGDYILIDEETQGVVRQITPRSVVLRRKNSFSIIVPNAQVTRQPVVNFNYTRNFLGIPDIVFTVPFFVDIAKVRNLLIQIIDSNPDILKSPQPNVWLDNFDQNGYVFLVRAYISSVNTLRQWEIASDVRYQIAQLFEKEKIVIAAPVRMLKTIPSDEKVE